MANRERGEIDVAIDDKTWTLRYSANSLAELEEALDKPINAIMATLQDRDNIRIKTLRAVVWAGFRDRHPEITQTDAGELITAIGFVAMMAKVRAALQAAFPDEDASAAGKVEAAARPR